MTYTVSKRKQPLFTPLQTGIIVFQLVSLCCLCIAGTLLIRSNNPTPTQIEVLSLPTQASTNTAINVLPPTWTPTFTIEPEASTTLTPATEFIPVSVTEATAPVSEISQGLVELTPGNTLQVHFIDVGQGDAIFILSPDGTTVILDGGDTDTGVLQYLQSNGVQHIDLMIASHPHSDHIGGLVQVLRALPVRKVITNGQMHTTSIYERFLDAIVAAKAEYVEVQRGNIITEGNLVFDVLHPASNIGNNLNNNSLVLRLAWGNTSFLFAGDAEKEAEASMLASGLTIGSDILKIAHHGSQSSSSPAFLAQVKPKVAIYSAGRSNQYGNPQPETLAALASIGAQVYGTDENGTIIVISDGNEYKIEVASGSPRYPPVVLPVITAPPSNTSGLEILSLTSPIRRGAMATLTAKTYPGAACKITVYHKSGASTAQGLIPKKADSNGNVSWTWKVGNRTTPGNWRIVVKANINGQTISREIIFMVTK